MKAVRNICHALASLAATLFVVGIASAQTSTLRPGSLLLYPDIESEAGRLTLVTLTNVAPAGVGTLWTFVRGDTCLESNLTFQLGGNDTLTAVTSALLPGLANGYLYISALDPNGQHSVFNSLIGEERIVDGFSASEYSVSPFVFEGIGDGALTDLDKDGIRDLDGVEYSEVSDQIIVPRFLGQSALIQSELVLIGLSGGSQFDTTVGLVFFNDNSSVFTTEFSFSCWTRTPLMSIDPGFGNGFLAGLVSDDPNEIAGAGGQQSGWMQIEGLIANSNLESIVDPAVVAVLIEGTPTSSNAGLPFGSGLQVNGDLLPNNLLGDFPFVVGDDQ